MTTLAASFEASDSLVVVLGGLVTAGLGGFTTWLAARGSRKYAKTVFTDLTFEASLDRTETSRKSVADLVRDLDIDSDELESSPDASSDQGRLSVALEGAHLAEIARLETVVQELQQEADAEERRYRLLRSYATQGLTQGTVSFWASVSAAIFGFLIILTGVVAALLGSDIQQATVPIIAGAVIDAVSLLFFAQDRRHQKTMFEFFERLREDRKLDEALALLRTIKDESMQSRVQAAMALHFAAVPEALRVLEQASSSQETPPHPQ